uniref:B-cell receptor CD22 n=1 Tax=Seriola lalandi dorsalis TaxID=1841481 RepID=A0A3B4YLF0_SERLL
VEIHCSYRSPSRLNDADTAVEKTFWFTRFSDNEPVDLRADSEYSGRVQYHCGENDCTLRITDLRESDSAEYKFRFITNQPGGKYTGEPGVTFVSSCHLPDHSSFIWYKNEREVRNEQGKYFDLYTFGPEDNYRCAVKGHGDFRSPPVCEFTPLYAPKLLSVSVSPSGEIVKGSSVNLTCSSDANPAANYTWYKENEDSPKASGQIFTIADLRPEHSGNYYCEAQNTRGCRNSTLNLTVGPFKGPPRAAGRTRIRGHERSRVCHHAQRPRPDLYSEEDEATCQSFAVIACTRFSPVY